MSSLLSAELSATCSALGYFDEKSNKYYADSNTLETVKDLIRFLRRDDETHDIRRQLGEIKVLQTDLLPLLKHYWEETDLFDVLLRLMVNLTTPPLMLWEEDIPTDKNIRNHFLQIEDHLQEYKQAFADEALWAILSTRLTTILEVEYAERGDENSLIIERIFILIRNILYVPADPSTEKRPDNDASVHDQVLWALHQSGMLDIILYVSSSGNEGAYYMHVLEILSFLLREQNATELASAALQRNHTEKIRDEAELVAIRHRETIQKQQKAKIYSGARHSRFGGTFVVKSMKSISDNELIYHKPLNKLDALNFDADKHKRKTPKNRLPVQTYTTERRSAFSVRLFLKEFCVEFINGAYNTLMYYVKDNLVRAKAQANDESYYLWALRFFMEFNRRYKFQVKLVSETMSVQSFHFVQQQMEKYFDMIQTDKKKLKLWSRRLHIALLAYRELLLTICVMDKSPDGTVRDSSKVIKNNIFYVLEYRELILTLLVTFDEIKMSNSYLNDLIETQHIFLKTFETFCSKDGSVVVQKKAKSGRKKKKEIPVAPVLPEFNLQTWDEVSPQISAVLEGAILNSTDVVPFDAASDVPIDEQKSDAMINIQRKLRNEDFENAIGLLRAAREVWPENDAFGNSNMPVEEEFLALKDIYLADLGENEPSLVQEQPIYNEYDEEEGDEDEDANICEGNFKFEDFIKRLANPKIVRSCGLALRNFEHNSVNTNHCIAKLLHRIAYDCKMYVMVFQVSIFISLRKVFSMKELPQYKELVMFAKYIMKQFLKVAEINKKIYIEALFWKSSKDAFDIEEGYGSYQDKHGAAANVWSEEQEDELRRLFMEHKENQLQDDVVDWIVNNLIDNTRSRRGVMKKLKELCLLTDYKGPHKSKATSRAPIVWDEDEENQLRELFEQFINAIDPIGCIMDRLDVPRSKNRIVEKLLVLGLIQDKKEIKKKRAKPSNPSRTRQSDNASSDSDDSNAGTMLTNSSTTTARNKQPKAKKIGKKASQARIRGKQASFPQLAKLAQNLMNSGLDEALGWLKDSFTDAIEDADDDSDEGIPLVPIMDYAVTAMENNDFQQLLKAFGIAEPFDEQESYWRIPSSIQVDTLNTFCELLTKAIDGTIIIPSEGQTDVTNLQNEQQNEESSDEDVFEKLKRYNNSRNGAGNIENGEVVENNRPGPSGNNLPSNEINTDSNDESENLNSISSILASEESSQALGKKNKIDVIRDDMEDSNKVNSSQLGEIMNIGDENQEPHPSSSKENQNEAVVSNGKSKKRKKMSRFITSDSEDEMDKENENDTNTQYSTTVTDGKRARSESGSDVEVIRVKKNRILIESDED